MTIRLVTDSTCDLPDSVIAQYNITVAPAYINVGQKSYLDGVDLTREQFYRNLPTFSPHPTTAAPAPGYFTEIYNRLAAEGATEVLSIHISAQLSAFLNSARLGAEATDAVRVTLFDSRQVTMGLGLLVLTAARALADGRSVAETVQLLSERTGRARVYAGLDTLEYLQRGGRVSGLQASIGSLLKIKPVLEIKDGLVHPSERVRTRKRLMPRLIEIVQGMGRLEELAVLYTGDRQEAQEFYDLVAPYFPAGSARLLAEVGPAVGVHAGPGALGFAAIKAG